jgi:hypothetical protein
MILFVWIGIYRYVPSLCQLSEQVKDMFRGAEGPNHHLLGGPLYLFSLDACVYKGQAKIERSLSLQACCSLNEHDTIDAFCLLAMSLEC